MVVGKCLTVRFAPVKVAFYLNQETKIPMLYSENSVLCVIDIQQRLLPHIDGNEHVVKNSNILIQSAKLLEIPILLTEQYPKGLGPTVPEIQSACDGIKTIEKTVFGCYDCEGFQQAFESLNRSNLVLCGIETHVCVLQTALAAMKDCVEVAIVADAVGSRAQKNHEFGLQRARQHGADIASTEMVVLEWLRDAAHPKFKEISGLIK